MPISQRFYVTNRSLKFKIVNIYDLKYWNEHVLYGLYHFLQLYVMKGLLCFFWYFYNVHFKFKIASIKNTVL